MDGHAPSPYLYRPAPPRWWPVIAGVFLGYFWALIALIPIAIAAWLLGLLPHTSTAGAVPHDLRNWPYVANGTWSLVANAIVSLGILALTAYFASREVAARIDRPVPPSAVLLVLVITAYAPGIGYRGVLPAAGIVSLLATAALVRWLVPRHAPWAGRVAPGRALLAAGGAALVIAGAYGVVHPMAFEAASSYENQYGGDPWQTGVAHTRYRENGRARYSFQLHNDGRFALTLTSVELVHVAPPIVGVEARAGMLRPPPFDASTPLHALRIPPRHDATVSLLLRMNGCSDALPGARATISRVLLHYRVLGLSLSQRVPLRPAPTVVCP